MATKYHDNKFPPKIDLDKEILTLLSQARTELGRYDGFLSSMLNSEILLSPLFTQEAVLSSKIEGTQSTLTEVLKFEGNQENQKGLSEEKRNDLKEILNYRHALNRAIELMNDKNYPLSQRLFKAAHKELMKGVRGKNKSPGVYRKIPVWIGPDKSNIETARFIPVDANNIQNAMSDFEKYVHYSEDYDDLIKIAILHAEFESIHPFLDGNGRTGRIINILYLSLKGLLDIPVLYLSRYIIDNKSEYYTLLQETREKESWEAWLLFMLEGIEETARQTVTLIQNILTLMQEYKVEIREKFPAMYSQDMINVLFKHPYTKIEYVAKELNCHRQTAGNYLNDLSKEGYLKRERIGKSNYYINEKLCQLFIEIRELEK